MKHKAAHAYESSLSAMILSCRQSQAQVKSLEAKVKEKIALRDAARAAYKVAEARRNAAFTAQADPESLAELSVLWDMARGDLKGAGDALEWVETQLHGAQASVARLKAKILEASTQKLRNT